MSSDDDESSSHLEKLLSVTKSSLPSTDVARSSSLETQDESENEDSSCTFGDIEKPSHPDRPIIQSAANNTDDCYSWLLHERERKLSEGGASSTDISTSSSSLSHASFPSLPMPKPPDGGWGWMVVLGAFIVLVICDGISYCFGVIYSEFLVQFQESRSKTSLVGSIFYGVSMILGPFASAMTTRFGCRKMTIVGGIVSSIGFILCYFATSLDMLFVTFSVVVGIGFSFCYVTSVIIVHFYFDKRRSFATGLAVCGTGVGTFTFAPLMDYLISEYGWRGLFLILAGLSLNLVVCGMLFRPLKFTEDERWQHFCAEFDKLPHGRGNLELARMRNMSECTEVTTEVEVVDEEPRTMSMLTLPTFACENTTNGSSDILIEALKNSRNPHLTAQRYMKNAYFQSDCQNTDVKITETRKGRIDDETYTISAISDSFTTLTDISSDGIFQEKKASEINHSKETSNHDFESNLNGKKSSAQILKLPNTLKVNQDYKKSSSFLDDLSNVMKSKTVSGMRMGKHNVVGTQLLLYRTDIFYRRYLSQAPDNNRCLLGTSCPELMESNAQPHMWKGYRQSFKRFLVRVCHFLRSMMDVRLFLKPFFAVFVISNFMFYFWSDVPYMFATDHALKQGFSAKEASFLISIIGILNAFGQVAFGILGDRKINLIGVYAIVLGLSGVFIGIVPLMSTYWSMALAYALFGFFVSIIFPFATVLLVEYLGVEQLASAYGVLMMMQGMANVLGPPFAGWISDITHSYDFSFYLSGIFCGFSGFVMLFILIPWCGVIQVANTEEKHQR